MEGFFMRKLIVLAIAACLMFALSGCGKKETAAPAAVNGAPAGAAAGSTASTELKLTATNFKFDQAEYKVKKGQEIKVTLENKEGMHGVEISGLKVKLDGNNKTATFKADKEGTYDIACIVPCGAGHATMKSKLIVEA
jgi:cytochrome c oxidase subunit 2